MAGHNGSCPQYIVLPDFPSRSIFLPGNYTGSYLCRQLIAHVLGMPLVLIMNSLKVFIYYSVYVHVHAHTCAHMRICLEIRGQLMGVSSLFPLCAYWGSSPGYQLLVAGTPHLLGFPDSLEL